MKIFRWCLALALAWMAFEGWARIRFDLNNPWLPMGLRKNLAPTSLEAHRLLPNRDLMAHRGIAFHTDANGFRCAPLRPNLPSAPKLLLGGDSIAFGMYLNFEDSLGYHLQNSLGKDIEVMVSALPAGSQAMSHDLLFGPDQLAKRTQARWLLHSINHYDETDNLRYFKDEIRPQGWRKHIREFKHLIGPYGIQMLQLKAQDFLKKDKRKDLRLWANTSNQTKPKLNWPKTQKALEELHRSSQSEGIQLALFFLPDQKELETPGHEHNRPIETWAKTRGIPLLDVEALLEKEPSDIRSRIFRSDRIHLTGQGAELIAKYLKGFIGELER